MDDLPGISRANRYTSQSGIRIDKNRQARDVLRALRRVGIANRTLEVVLVENGANASKFPEDPDSKRGESLYWFFLSSADCCGNDSNPNDVLSSLCVS